MKRRAILAGITALLASRSLIAQTRRATDRAASAC